MGRNLGPLNIKDTYEGLVQITSGSIITDGSGSDITYLNITASNADQAGTAGFAVSASWSDQAGTAGFTPTATSASFADQAGTSGFAATASFTPNAVVTASYSDPTLTFEKGDGTTFDLTISTSPTLQDVLDNGNTATQDIILTGDIQATNITASGANITNLVVGDITGSNATFASASIGFLTAVTGSVTKIGDAYILLNTNDVNRYAGIKVEDSGSAVPTNFTASLNFDSLTNDWFYEYTSSGDPDNFGVVMFGPEYGTKGSPTYNTANTLVKADGGHHLLDSSITDDGTDVVVSANISASGFVSASEYYGDGSKLSGVQINTGSFLVTASYSSPTLTFEKGDSSTFDLTITATAFPFVGEAVITGSLIQGADNLTFTGTESAILASATASLNGFYSAIIAAKDSVITNPDENNAIFGGREAGIAGTGNGNVLLGVEYGGINSAGNNRVVIGGYGNTITGGGFDTVIGGESNAVGGGGYNHIYGSVGSSNGGGNRNVIIGGESNTITGNTRSVIVGGTGMTTSKDDEVVVPNLTISGSVASYDGGVIAVTSSLGTGSLIDNVGTPTGSEAIEHLVYLSQAEYNAITPDSNTMYVISGSGETIDDLVISGSLSGDVKALPVASSTGSLDCAIGNYFTLGLANAADTRLEALNLQIGQTINIKITNNAVAAGTISFSPEFQFEGGTPFTASAATDAVDIITCVSFDGTSLQTVGVKNFS